MRIFRQPYFYHEATAVTTWERPAAAPAAAVKSQEVKSAAKQSGGNSSGGMAGGLLSQIQVCLLPVFLIEREPIALLMCPWLLCCTNATSRLNSYIALSHFWCSRSNLCTLHLIAGWSTTEESWNESSRDTRHSIFFFKRELFIRWISGENRI